MQTNWAEDNLQTIRTLMERSAIYRRALAPIMIFCGAVGIVGGVAGWRLQIKSGSGFVLFWSAAAAVALVGAFLLVRRQALKDSEPFWSPPTKRVTRALIPPFLIGAFVAGVLMYDNGGGDFGLILIPVWCWAFGCAIHSAGFFMPRGMQLFGWVFILAGCLLAASFVCDSHLDRISSSPHLFMGGIFGGLHLAYGIYLYFTESRKTVA